MIIKNKALAFVLVCILCIGIATAIVLVVEHFL